MVIVTGQISIHHDAVAIGEVEHHRIVSLHVSEAGQPGIRNLYPLEITGIQSRTGYRIVHEGKGQWGLRHLGPVTHLTDHEVITDQHAVLHRSGGNGERLEHIPSDERCHHRGPEDGLAPFAHHAFLDLGPISGAHECSIILEGLPRKGQPRESTEPPLQGRGPFAKGDSDLHMQDRCHEQVGPGKQQGNQPVLRTLEHAEQGPIVQSWDITVPRGQSCPGEQTGQGEDVDQGNGKEQDQR